MNRQTAYLTMAVLGAVIPIIFFANFFLVEGLDVIVFAQAIFANGAAGGFAADLFISSFVFWIFMFSRKDGPKPWLFIAMNLFVGLSLALPAYLWVSHKS